MLRYYASSSSASEPPWGWSIEPGSALAEYPSHVKIVVSYCIVDRPEGHRKFDTMSDISHTLEVMQLGIHLVEYPPQTIFHFVKISDA